MLIIRLSFAPRVAPFVMAEQAGCVVYMHVVAAAEEGQDAVVHARDAVMNAVECVTKSSIRGMVKPVAEACVAKEGDNTCTSDDTSAGCSILGAFFYETMHKDRSRMSAEGYTFVPDALSLMGSARDLPLSPLVIGEAYYTAGKRAYDTVSAKLATDGDRVPFLDRSKHSAPSDTEDHVATVLREEIGEVQTLMSNASPQTQPEPLPVDTEGLSSA